MNILNTILNTKQEEAARLRKNYSLSSFSNFEFFNRETISFTERIKKNKNIAIISEIKKTSPSKGLIRKNFDHTAIATEYFQQKVDAVSVLTDKNYFQGSTSFLTDIARFKAAPLLRKDFIIDEYQVFEAKGIGADFILLICEALSKQQIRDLTLSANEIGLEILLELHSEKQIDKIDFDLNKIIGINNRNLENFSVSLEITKTIAAQLPKDVIIVSESGISRKADIDYLKNTYTKAILVGEHLMSSNDISSSLRDLKEWCTNEN